MLSWLMDSTLGQFLSVLFVSMVPVIELRGGIPLGVGMGLSRFLVFIAAVVGNMIPVPFIVVYINKVFMLIRRHMPKLDGFVSRLERHGGAKGERVERYGAIALLTFVAIPLPGTGAWTGALIAACVGMKLKPAFLSIFIGVLIAAVLVMLATLGVISII